MSELFKATERPDGKIDLDIIIEDGETLEGLTEEYIELRAKLLSHRNPGTESAVRRYPDVQVEDGKVFHFHDGKRVDDDIKSMKYWTVCLRDELVCAEDWDTLKSMFGGFFNMDGDDDEEE